MTPEQETEVRARFADPSTMEIGPWNNTIRAILAELDRTRASRRALLSALERIADEARGANRSAATLDRIAGFAEGAARGEAPRGAFREWPIQAGGEVEIRFAPSVPHGENSEIDVVRIREVAGLPWFLRIDGRNPNDREITLDGLASGRTIRPAPGVALDGGAE